MGEGTLTSRLKQKLSLFHANKRAAEVGKRIQGCISTEGAVIGTTSLEEAVHLRRTIVQGLMAHTFSQREFRTQSDLVITAQDVLGTWPDEYLWIGALADTELVPFVVCNRLRVIEALDSLFVLLSKNIIVSSVGGADILVLEYDHFSTGDIYTLSRKGEWGQT